MLGRMIEVKPRQIPPDVEILRAGMTVVAT
jgi:hypothetical protein